MTWCRAEKHGGRADGILRGCDSKKRRVRRCDAPARYGKLTVWCPPIAVPGGTDTPIEGGGQGGQDRSRPGGEGGGACDCDLVSAYVWWWTCGDKLGGSLK